MRSTLVFPQDYPDRPPIQHRAVVAGPQDNLHAIAAICLAKTWGGSGPTPDAGEDLLKLAPPAAVHLAAVWPYLAPLSKPVATSLISPG